MPVRLNPVLGKKFHPADPVSNSPNTSIRWGWRFSLPSWLSSCLGGNPTAQKIASAVSDAGKGKPTGGCFD
jgi:hypothetical protein